MFPGTANRAVPAIRPVRFVSWAAMIIAAVFPGAGILALIWLLGAWLIVLGVILIAFALSLRQLAHSPTRVRAA